MDKAHIKVIVDQLAAENAGKPPGRNRIARAGISKTKWQRHWARWTDALREFGYTPNALLKPLDEAEVLDALAALVIRIGRLPSDNDFAHHRNIDPQFPSRWSFRKIGNMEELVRKLAEHCEGREGFKPVVDLCSAYQPVPRRADSEDVSVNGDTEYGFVYLMKSGKRHKIGRANSAGRREYELSIQSPEPVKLVHSISTDDPVGIEAYWHNRFKDKRRHGEWFELNAADVAAFKRRKFQ